MYFSFTCLILIKGVFYPVEASLYKRTLFYYSSLYCTSQILCFSQIDSLWQPCLRQIYQHHFYNSICSLLVSVTHFDKSSNISNLLLAKRLCKIILFCRLMIIYLENIMEYEGFPDSSLVKNLPANAGDMDSIPGPGRYHMVRNN